MSNLHAMNIWVTRLQSAIEKNRPQKFRISVCYSWSGVHIAADLASLIGPEEVAPEIRTVE
jgi:hypothetical protein